MFIRRMIVRAGMAAILLVPALGVVAAAAPPATVSIDNFTFNPATLSVPLGGTVTWRNADDVPHAVRAVDNSFHSSAMDTGDSYSFTFTKPGVYSYFCSIHPHMVGKVIVRAN